MAKDLDLWFLFACLGVCSLLLGGCGAGGVKMTKIEFMDDGLQIGTVPICIIKCTSENEREAVLQLDPDKLAGEPSTEGGMSWRTLLKGLQRYTYVPFSHGRSEVQIDREGKATLVIMADFPEPVTTFPSDIVPASEEDRPNRVVIEKPGKEHTVKVRDNCMYRSE